jgi:hypothetical protein
MLKEGRSVGHTSAGHLLHEEGYLPRANRERLTDRPHPDHDRQLPHIGSLRSIEVTRAAIVRVRTAFHGLFFPCGLGLVLLVAAALKAEQLFTGRSIDDVFFNSPSNPVNRV